MRFATRATLLLSVLLCFITAYESFVIYDDEGVPYGTNTVITVDTVNAPTKQQALNNLQTVVNDLQVNLYKNQPNLHGNDSGRILFAFIGDQPLHQYFYGSGYPNFTPHSFSTQVRLGSQITTEDLRGTYFLSTKSTPVNKVLAALKIGGFDGHIERVHLITAVGLALGRTHLVGTIAAIGAALLLALVYEISQRRKIYALRELHGYRKSYNIRADLWEVLKSLLVLSAGVFATCLIVLYFVNGLAQFPRFISLVAPLLACLFIFVLIVTACSVSLFDSVNVPKVLKGEKTVIRIGTLAALVQIGILVLAVLTVNTSLDRISAISQAQKSYQHWISGEPLYLLRLSMSGTHEDDEKTAPVLAEIVQRFENEGKALLANQDKYNYQLAPYEYGGSQTITVNNEYLQREKVFDVSGKRIVPIQQGEGEFTVLIPRSYRGNPNKLANKYATELKTICEEEKTITPCHVQPTFIYTAPGQTLPTYGQTDDGVPIENQSAATVTDPVLILINSSSRLIPPSYYLSFSSTGTLFFEDAAKLEKTLQSARILSAFQGIDNAADSANRAIQISRQEVKLDWVSMIVAIVVFALSSLILATLYCDRWKKQIFIRLIHGYSFTSRHRGYITLTILISVLSAGSAYWLYHSTPTLNTLIAVGFAVLAVLASLLMLKTYETRMCADYLKRD